MLGRVATRATRRNIPEDTILHSHRRENLKSYIYMTWFHIFILVGWVYLKRIFFSQINIWHSIILQSSL
jgi:hypothetical protein